MPRTRSRGGRLCVVSVAFRARWVDERVLEAGPVCLVAACWLAGGCGGLPPPRTGGAVEELVDVCAGAVVVRVGAVDAGAVMPVAVAGRVAVVVELARVLVAVDVVLVDVAVDVVVVDVGLVVVPVVAVVDAVVVPVAVVVVAVSVGVVVVVVSVAVVMPVSVRTAPALVSVSDGMVVVLVAGVAPAALVAPACA